MIKRTLTRWFSSLLDSYLASTDPLRYCLEYPERIAFESPPAVRVNGNVRVFIYRISDNKFLFEYNYEDGEHAIVDGELGRIHSIYKRYGY